MNIRNGEIVCEVCGTNNCEHVLSFKRLLGRDFEDDDNGLEIRDIIRRVERKRHKPPISDTLLPVSKQGLVDLYKVSKFEDGSYFCTCPACKTLRGISPTDVDVKIKEDNGAFKTIKLHGCKHIKEAAMELGGGSNAAYSYYPTLFQKLLLGMFCPPDSIENAARIPLTTTQTYAIVDALLKHHGLEFSEALRAIRRGETIPKFPFISVGIEFEAGNVSSTKIKELINSKGLYGYVSSIYNSIEEAARLISTSEDIRRYGVLSSNLATNYCGINVGTDSSISGLSNPFEIKSNRLTGIYGANSIAAFSDFLQELKENGMRVNTSCGLHIHVGVTALDSPRQIGKAIVSYQELFLNSLKYLVHPSRLSNRFCELYPRDLYPKLIAGQLREAASSRYRIINCKRYLSGLMSFRRSRDINNIFSTTLEFRVFNAIGGEVGKSVKSLAVLHAILMDSMLYKQAITPDLVEKIVSTAKETVENNADVSQLNSEQKEKIKSALIFKWLLEKFGFESNFGTWQEMGDTLKKRFAFYSTVLRSNSVDKEFDEKLLNKLNDIFYNENAGIYLEFKNLANSVELEQSNQSRQATFRFRRRVAGR